MCKSINVSLNYKEVGIYFKYSTPLPLWKLSKNGVKSGCFESICDGQHESVLEMKEECKVFCVNLILWSIVAQKGTNILIFYILEYGAENGAESGAK